MLRKFNKERLKDKFIGAMIGTFVGDALGMPFEGWHFESVEDECGIVTEMYKARLGRGTYTDDTQMMIAVAESLLACQGFDGQDMAQKFLENFERNRGYGSGTIQALSLIKSGISWDQAGKKIFKGGSFGNGSAMRIAPIGVFFSNNLNLLRHVTYESSKITHAHLLGQEGAFLQAAAIAFAFRANLGEKLNCKKFFDQLIELTAKETKIYKEKLLKAKELLGKQPSKQDVIRILGHDSRAFNSVPTAIYAFLSHLEDFANALSYAVGLGGDADTIGAMTGAIAGALHGLSRIPSKWIDALENKHKGKDYVIALGEDLFESAWKKHIQN